MQVPAGVTPALVWLAGYLPVSHEMDSNANMSPEMSHGVLECEIVMLQNRMLMIFVIKKAIICARPCIYTYMYIYAYEPEP